jgi:hypothetical protein
VSPAFAELIARMTDAEPSRRPTALEVAGRLLELCRVVEEEPAIPSPVPTAPGAPNFVRPEPPRPSPPLLLPKLPPKLAALVNPPAPVVTAPDVPMPVPTAPFGSLEPIAPFAVQVPASVPMGLGTVTDPGAGAEQYRSSREQSRDDASEPGHAPGAMRVAPGPSTALGANGAPELKLPTPAPTVPMAPPAWMLQSGAKPVDLSFGKAPPPRPVAAPPRSQASGLSQWLSSFTISIAASDFKLIATSMIAMAMLASTVALGAHVLTLRSEARELATNEELLKPHAVKEPKYNSEQLKQILRQKEAAHREY